ncbi:APC family permease [Nocardioides dubius]|uniref:Amino acid transporter n=1 Tax=Nocardioides dubius TaxID=317019 RepID=A0ABP4EAT2_9ACTN
MQRDAPRLREVSRFAGLERRVVTERDLVAHSVSVMAPSVSALGLAFVLPDVVGPGAWLSVLLGFGLAHLLAGAFGQFARRMRAPGSLAAWTARGLGVGPAMVVASSLIFGYAVLTAFGITAAARRISGGWEAVSGEQAGPGLEFGAVGAVIAACLVVIARGVRWSTRFALIAESLALVCLVVVLAVTAARWGLPSWSDFALAGASPMRIALGAALIMTITVGFESAVGLAVESARPFATVPRSMHCALALTGLLFAVSVALNSGPAGGHGAGRIRWLRPGEEHSPLDGLILLGLALSLAVLALCAWTALSRLLFAFGREAIAWRRLGAVHPRAKVPHIATLAVVPLVLAPVAITVATGHRLGWVTGHLLETATLALCVAYAVTAAAVVPFLLRIDELRARSVCGAVAAALGVLGLTGVVVWHDAMAGRGWLLGIWAAVVGAGLAWWLVLRGRVSGLADRIGAHDETLRDDVLLPGQEGLHV